LGKTLNILNHLLLTGSWFYYILIIWYILVIFVLCPEFLSTFFRKKRKKLSRCYGDSQ